MKCFLSAVALIVLAGNLVSCQTSTIDNKRITLSFTEDTDLTQDVFLESLKDRMGNTIGNVSDISVDGQTVTLTFKDVVTEIGDEAFSKLALTSITIPNSVTKIRGGAFLSCLLLTSVTIPDSVTEIGFAAFSGCSSLRNFSGKFASADGRCLITNGKLIAFAGDGLSNYTIPNSVTEIGSMAFAACSSLTAIIIPDSVTEIGGAAFMGCESLTSITIPDSVTEIESMAFTACSSLTSITIPNSVTEIGSGAFKGCPLESVTVPRSAEIAEGSFEETTCVIYQ